MIIKTRTNYLLNLSEFCLKIVDLMSIFDEDLICN